MSAQWMLYALAVGCVITAAALAAEQGTRLGRRPGRWVWAVAAVLTVVLPFVAPERGVAPAPLRAGVSAPATTPTLVLGGFPATPAVIRPAWPTQAEGARIDTGQLARWGWGVASALALAALAGAHVALRRRRRGWNEEVMAGVPVLVSADAGPAVIGVLRPRIVVPRWLLGLPASRQALVMAHEQAHIAAGDARLLAAMALLLVAMPWNLPLWFQWRRLRLAIEIDCDARVLAQGHAVGDYGAALIDVARQAPRASLSHLAFATPAVAESASHLVRRIRLMTRRTARWHRIVAPVLVLLALDIGVVAARIAPPREFDTPRPVIVPQSVRQPLAGYYQVNAHRIAIVSVTANGLEMKINAEPSWRLTPAAPDRYFLPGTGVRVRFDRTAGTLTLGRYGVDMAPAPRTDAAAVERADAYVAARIARGQALPGGEAIVRRNVGARDPAQLHSADFTPAFLQLSKVVMPRERARFAAYGRVEAVAFDGVNRWGWDRYKVRYANATVTWAIWLDEAGRVAAATPEGRLP